MATPNKIIEHVDQVKPNVYRTEEKFQWLCDLDGIIKRVVMQESEGVHYAFPEDLDTQLLVPHPWEGIYALYLEAQIDLHNKDYEDYNNAILVYTERLEEFRRAYIREHRPKSAGSIRL